MFGKENRYMTKGIADSIDFGLQVLLWNLIDELEIEKDYLQVFQIRGTGKSCIIEHSQEVPEYKRVYEYPGTIMELGEEVTIFAIDDGNNSTMLFADEY